MPYNAVPGRVSRAKLARYALARSKEPLYVRWYLSACEWARIDPYNWDSLPHSPNHVLVENVYVPIAAANSLRVETAQRGTPRAPACGKSVGSIGCLCASRGGPPACRILSTWSAANCPAFAGQDCACPGSVHALLAGTFRISDFAGSPQQHAILNRHLLDYFRDRTRAQETTPYHIPPSQQHLLADLGMELPQPDAPVVPHGLHKSVEEAQLSRMRNYLPANDYNLVCVKDAKLARLPIPSSRQNPVRDAKDSSRFPGWAIRDADLSVSATHFMHDVASEVTPHELVEKLSRENPEAHLFVTGMNPAEVLDRATSFEPASHQIHYEGLGFNYVFAGSAAESYYTPIDVTLAWINTASVCASNGRVYHVVLLDDKLGHCLYHVFCGDVAAQHTRTYTTGSMVRLPPTITGTVKPEYIPAKLLTATLDFVARTPDLSTRNLAAKVTQVANVVNPRTTARERWIVYYIMSQLAPYKTWAYYARRAAWQALYAITFQWQMFTPMPDVYRYIDERERFRVVHPTEGGGWSRTVNYASPLKSIPNCPTLLQRLSAFTGAAFVFLLPKLALGEVFTCLFHAPLWDVAGKVWGWLDFKPLRALLTLAVVVSATVVPGHVLDYFTSLAGHFYRQLWWPGYVWYLVQVAIVELSGAPGASLCYSPGRGWAWQALVWAVAIHSVLPGLVPALVVPWVAYSHGWGLLMTCWLAAVVLENLACAYTGPIFPVGPTPYTRRHFRTYDKVLEAVRSVKVSATTASHGTFQLRLPVPYTGTPRCAAYTVPCPYGTNSCLAPALRSTLRMVPRVTVSIAPTSMPSTLELAAGDAGDCAYFAYWWFASSVNFIARTCFRFQRRLGNCGRVPTLTPLPAPSKPTLRRRNVDRVLPTVVLQPNTPIAPVGSQLAIPPDGLDFPDWLQQVTAAYTANPRLHPALTPGQDCFWQAVSSLGGTPHMWFCWYMEFMRRRVPVNQAVVGPVTVIDMHLFATVSGIGIRLSGVTEEVTLSRDTRPTLHLRLSHVPLTNNLHVEVAFTPLPAEGVANFARVLRTLRQFYPNWGNDVVVAYQNAPLDSVPVATASLCAITGGKILPTSMAEIDAAIQASFDVVPFTPNNMDGYVLDLAGALGQGDPLWKYVAPVSRARVAMTTPPVLWKNFRTQKVGANGRQSADNATRNNVRPEPAMHVTLANELATKVQDYMQGTLPAVALEEELVHYTADINRAARLVSDLKAHPSVLGGKADARWLQSLDSVLDLYKLEGKTVTVPVRAYLGTGGCGKTTATAAYLKSLSPGVRQMARVVSHTESLRAQAKLALDFPEMRGVNFPTLPGLLSEPSTGPIVFDDAGKFYGGVLDLVLLCNPLVPEVVVNGDPAQALSKFPVGGTQSEFDKGPMVIAEYTTKYATISHRWFTLLAETFGLHTTNPTRGHLTHTVGPKSGIPVTTASPRYVQVLASAGRQAYTHDTIQGEDFDEEVEVDMSALEEAMSDRTAYVALSRSKKGVYLHMNAADPGSRLKAPPSGSDLLNAIIYSMRSDNLPTLLRGNALTRGAFYAHLHSCMPKLKWFAHVGSSLPAAAYQNVTSAAVSHFVSEGLATETSVCDAAPSSSGFVDTVLHETHWAAKEFREVGCHGLQTDQFKEVSFVNPHVHKRQDHATYKLTVQKRINNATPTANYTRKKLCPRTDMIDEFTRLCPTPPAWSPEKHAHYMDRARVEYEAGRTESAVLEKLAAHDPERTGSDVLNSLKAQVIKKDEKRGKFEAIPGQLIYEYDLQHTLEDAAYSLFLEEELFPAFPSNFLFYRRMDPDTFKREYEKTWRVGNGVHTSDVTRWDVGCDAGVLNFDEHVFRTVRFPADYVDAYVNRRLSTRTQHGTLQTSQPSGDRFTWTLNSMRRAVVASLVLQVTSADTVAINGDDEAMDRCAEALPFPDTVWEFKDQNGLTGEFSGFELGGPTPLYSARGIHYRTMILCDRDPSAQEKWVNYLELLRHCDPDAWESVDVARLAEQHMRPELFAKALPVAFRPLFPHTSFPV